MASITETISRELNVKQSQIDAAVGLLDEGATVPFISRYRKEATGGLDDQQLRQLDERLTYLRELDERRASVLSSIDEQGKLTSELKTSIEQADTKTRLEDLYLPYKKKRRTKGQIAIEAGLQPLADAILADQNLTPETAAKDYVDTDNGVEEVGAALDGAKYILMERFAEQADLLANLRSIILTKGVLMSSVSKGQEEAGQKFQDYFDYREPIAKIPPHRALALFRGRRESVLTVKADVPDLVSTDVHPCERAIAEFFSLPYFPDGNVSGQPAASRWLTEVVRWTWRVKLQAQVETDLLGELREKAEAEAIKVFAANLQDVLLASPAGQRATIGLDPGLRTGVKVAVVDSTGRYVENTTIYPHPPKKQWDQSIATLAGLAKAHRIELLAIGNGTASRETEKLAVEIISKHPELKLTKVVVSEAGASVYSASEFASAEFPELDVTVRGAISIARRLQDPLAELVKIEPKSIGVGQYQHDVSQFKLARSLDAVIEDCVNAVGVEVNTASVALLNRVSGLTAAQASNIVEWRNTNGQICNREELKKVPRLGEKAFEQAAGFLRIRNGDTPLDSSAVHPESYQLVEAIAEKNQCEIVDLIGNKPLLKTIEPGQFVNDEIGLPTVVDIISELDKPGRDPRPEFKVATFKEGVEKISDLAPDMVLEGSVTNVTNFGAFVDIGVHQDGLVHISALANKFVKDPREVVKAGDIVRVKVMSVDTQRKRIALTMRLEDSSTDREMSNDNKPRNAKRARPQRTPVKQAPQAEGAFALALAKAKSRK